MAVYIEEEEVWKCPKHPSKRRRNGICPVCLRDRLISLCPDCANVRPCSCCAATTASSSSASSSSSFSLFSSSSSRGGRVSDLIDGEPAFRRSRSVGIPFLFTRFAKQQKECEQWNNNNNNNNNNNTPGNSKAKTTSFWSKLKFNKSKRRHEEIEEKENQHPKENFRNDTDSSEESVCRISNTSIEEFARMMMKSRSVHVSMMTGDGKSSATATKGKGWSFPSPMKVFRHSSKTTHKVVVHDRSPLYRG